jgi:hypothetical protein
MTLEYDAPEPVAGSPDQRAPRTAPGDGRALRRVHPFGSGAAISVAFRPRALRPRLSSGFALIEEAWRCDPGRPVRRTPDAVTSADVAVMSRQLCDTFRL